MGLWNTTVTNKGAALQAKSVRGTSLKFTRVVSGSGTVPITALKEQTNVGIIEQTLSIEGIKISGSQYTITVLLSNLSLEKRYYLSQIGFYATDPDEGEILFAIAQIDEAKLIPNKDESAGYNLEFAFTFKIVNGEVPSITPDMAAYMTREQIENLVSNMVDDMIECGSDIEE